MTSIPKLAKGGCRCGAAAYEVDLKGAHTLVCHCTDCQRLLGAPFSVFSQVPSSQFRWLSPPDGRYSVSDEAVRLYCTKCGTNLKWEGVATPDEAEFNSMTLEDPGLITVDEEIFTRSRLGWLSPVAGAVQHDAARPR